MLVFSKYQGAGNDFVVVDMREAKAALSPEVVVELCDRHKGIGADGVLSLWSHELADGEMRIQNADGSNAGMCGNGMRCMLQFLFDLEVVEADRTGMTLVVGSQVYECNHVGDRQFAVGMGKAETEHALLPAEAICGELLRFQVGGHTFEGRCHYFGNPHLSIFVEDDPMGFAESFGALLESHEDFSDRVNVSFSRDRGTHFDTVVYERGVGITQACGSGACAVAVSAVRSGLREIDQSIDIQLPGGLLSISVDRDWRVVMRGPAERVYEGKVEIA